MSKTFTGENNNSLPHYDIIIIGAGLSGIAAAYHFQTRCPNKSFALLEGRSAMGGTWDLFRYPGIRSDSDMYTLGFSFNPWPNPKAIADGPSILQYIKDTATKFDIDRKILYQHQVIGAKWSKEEKCWLLSLAPQAGRNYEQIKAKFIMACSGYYSYEQGYEPRFEGADSFEGIITHPQKWDENLDYSHKKVVIIGSGATAITLVPEMAKKAAKVTMLQRSPTYIKKLPSRDASAGLLRRLLPLSWSYSLIRFKNISVNLLFYLAARRWPKTIKKYLLKEAKRALGKHYKEKDFNPAYNPWDQRLCVVPDGDLFEAIKAGKAEIVTAHISHFSPKGIVLTSGQELEADIVVTATGLQVQLLGGMSIEVDERQLQPQEVHCYKGVMLSEIPNFAIAVGYTNASWTLKCELSCRYIARLLGYMDKKDYKVCTPRFDTQKFSSAPLLDFDAGYIRRAAEILPRQGSKAPWKVYQNYFLDSFALRYGAAIDEYLEFQS